MLHSSNVYAWYWSLIMNTKHIKYLLVCSLEQNNKHIHVIQHNIFKEKRVGIPPWDIVSMHPSLIPHASFQVTIQWQRVGVLLLVFPLIASRPSLATRHLSIASWHRKLHMKKFAHLRALCTLFLTQKV